MNLKKLIKLYKKSTNNYNWINPKKE